MGKEVDSEDTIGRDQIQTQRRAASNEQKPESTTNTNHQATRQNQREARNREQTRSGVEVIRVPAATRGQRSKTVTSNQRTANSRWSRRRTANRVNGKQSQDSIRVQGECRLLRGYLGNQSGRLIRTVDRQRTQRTDDRRQATTGSRGEGGGGNC